MPAYYNGKKFIGIRCYIQNHTEKALLVNLNYFVKYNKNKEDLIWVPKSAIVYKPLYGKYAKGDKCYILGIQYWFAEKSNLLEYEEWDVTHILENTQDGYYTNFW